MPIYLSEVMVILICLLDVEHLWTLQPLPKHSVIYMGELGTKQRFSSSILKMTISRNPPIDRGLMTPNLLIAPFMYRVAAILMDLQSLIATLCIGLVKMGPWNCSPALHPANGGNAVLFMCSSPHATYIHKKIEIVTTDGTDLFVLGAINGDSGGWGWPETYFYK